MLSTRIVRITVGSLAVVQLVAAPAVHVQHVVLDNTYTTYNTAISGQVEPTTPMELLLLTGLMIDRAALSPARGLDFG
jgi:hypothetical protein